jgi:hypothetical protein
MFEQEIEVEKHESSVVPLLLITALILAVVGVAGYFIWQNHQVLDVQQATALVDTAISAPGPAVIHFHTGLLTPSVDLKPLDPNYRLLDKAGLVKVGKSKGRQTPIALTPEGEKQLQAISGLRRNREKDGTEAFVVPIAQRKLVEIANIKMNNPTHAVVEFTWKWEPNRLGEVFDASGTLVKSFNTWDRATLIEKYGANFYRGEPTKAVLALVKTDKGWQIGEE